MRANPSAIWLRFEFSTQTNRTLLPIVSPSVVVRPGQQQPGVGQHAVSTATTPQRSWARQAVCLEPRCSRTPDGVTSACRTGYCDTAPCSYSTSTETLIDGNRAVPIWMILASLVVSSRWSVSSATQTWNTQAV